MHCDIMGLSQTFIPMHQDRLMYIYVHVPYLPLMNIIKCYFNMQYAIAGLSRYFKVMPIHGHTLYRHMMT